KAYWILSPLITGRIGKTAMKKKYIFMPLMSLLLLTMVSLKSHANEFLTLTGQVKEIDIIEEDTKTIKLKIGLDLTLKNISESNIIVYK
ncbi:hypothetical protein OFM15_30305, partial [Escherichia coli]|nr:hypothetical protein [Escherichia coli]